MTDYQTITFEIDAQIAVLRLDRPDRMNALNAQMRAEIADAATLRGARRAVSC